METRTKGCFIKAMCEPEHFTVANLFGPPTPLVAEQIAPSELTEPFRLLHGIERELVAAYRICGDPNGYRVAEAVTFGCPDGIAFRLTLTGPGMRKDVWEALMPAEASIGAMVRAYWSDPGVLTAKT